MKKLDSIGMKVFAGCLDKDSVGAIGLKHSCSERYYCRLIISGFPSSNPNIYCIYHKYRDTISPYHTCPIIFTGPF